jgi:hypothetical protein
MPAALDDLSDRLDCGAVRALSRAGRDSSRPGMAARRAAG